MTRRDGARQLVESELPPGLIAYRDGVAVGWVAVAPRHDYRRLNKGRDTAPIDDRPNVWAVPCFFIAPQARRSGVSAALLDAAMAFAAGHGAEFVEGVPGDPRTKTRTAGANYTGIVPTFEAAGFEEVARRTPKGRVIMRRQIGRSKR
jgi:GNAT superfamily N-acetyltransferase